MWIRSCTEAFGHLPAELSSLWSALLELSGTAKSSEALLPLSAHVPADLRDRLRAAAPTARSALTPVKV